jgi:hypothetical protein
LCKDYIGEIVMNDSNECSQLYVLLVTANNLILTGERKASDLSTLLQDFIKPTITAKGALLQEKDQVTVVVDQTISLSKALEVCDKTAKVEALWVDQLFKKILVQSTSAVPTSVTVKPYILQKCASDSEIRNTLPVVHMIKQTEFVSLLATELSKVRTGRESDILAKDRLCLFYVGSLAVFVRWDHDKTRWSVSAWRLGIGDWNAETLVFSCV